jgi:RNA polymerase sigma-70 factor (ECF subfamily)
VSGEGSGSRVGRGKPLRHASSDEGLGDPELLKAVADGDLRALGTLYDRYARDVWRVVRRTLGESIDTDDVVHATFLNLTRIAPSYDGRTSCRNWLRGIAVRLAIRHRRGTGRFRRMLESLGHAVARKAGPAHPERLASDNEELRNLEAALRRLDPKKRGAFVLVELEGLTTEEAARALQVPAATVRTRLFNARRELKSALAEGGGK